jgi:hypothetical protein
MEGIQRGVVVALLIDWPLRRGKPFRLLEQVDAR